MRRRALTETDSASYGEQLDVLSAYQQQLEEIWKSARWITEVTSNARDRQITSCGLSLDSLFSFSSNRPPNVPPPPNNVQPPDGHGNSDQSDNGEDNSDVGYHSDQSMEKTGLGSAAAIRAAVDTESAAGTSSQLQIPVHNPTYDWPDALPQRGEPNPLQRSNRVYMNIFPRPEYVNQETLHSPTSLTEATIDSLVTGSNLRRTRNESFLQADYGHRRRYATPLHFSPPIESSTFQAQIAVGKTPISLSTDSDPEYVNHPLPTTSRCTGDSDSTTGVSFYTPSRRSQTSASGTVSDTELLSKVHSQSRGKAQRHATLDFDDHRNFEDLSMIDHLYSVAARGAATSLPHSPNLSRPETAPLPMSKSTSGLAERNTSRSSSDRSPAQAGVLRVYAAYPCGLAKGTSVKLQLTQKTTSREVVNLVVQQLNKAVQLKGLSGPLFTDEEYTCFCLVAVIGARERILRDDFAPLELQNPWAKGRLFVRRREDLLAALEYGNEAKV